jgi:hypothetical protein
MRKFWPFLLACTALLPYSYAVETKTWIQNEQSDFEKGTIKNLSVRSDGRLTLAPSFRRSSIPPSPTCGPWPKIPRVRCT